MTTDAKIWIGLLLLACVGLSFLFSGMETGVLALNRFRVRQKSRSGNRRAAALHGFLENPEEFLWTILVGNTVVNFIIFSVGAIELHDLFRNKPAVWAVIFVVGVFIFYIVCELAPKTLFQRYPNRLTLLMAGPFQLIHRVLTPLVAVAAWLSRGLLHWTGGKAYTGRLFGSRDELRFVMQESAAGLSSEERTMINRVLDLPQRRVRQVMVPMANAACVNETMPLGQALAFCNERNLTRVPIFDTGSRTTVGLLNLERVLYLEGLDKNKPVRDYMQSAVFLPGEMHLEQALRRMQQTGGRLAVVLGPNQREIGIISLQDILKVIFGEVTL